MPAHGDGYYHTGDVASRDAQGYLTYAAAMDDVFSLRLPHQPLRAESVLIEHPRGEAAVVPSPTHWPIVPKAFVVLAANCNPTPIPPRNPAPYARARLALQA